VSDVDVSVQRCPACVGDGGVALQAGADLDGCWCQRCGGVLLPATGSERVLHQLLALDRAALMELAEGFGGRRFACPWCTARMRCLVVRGVDLDLCFHCGGLWLETGELERLSGNRHTSPKVTTTTTTTTSTTQLQARPAAISVRADATVRLHVRSGMRRTVGSVVRAGGLGVLAAPLVLPTLGLPTATLVVAAAAVVVGTVVLRRQVVDVFPRARRLLRSRAWLPTSARDERAEPLDDKAVVVVRRLLGGTLADAEYVDSCGRLIAPIATGTARSVAATAIAHAKRLGCRIVDDDADDTPAVPPAWSLMGDRPVVFRRLPGPKAFIQVEARREGRTVMTIKNAVPARGDEDRLSLCFHADVAGAAVVRVHDDGGGHVVFVGVDGDPIASARERQVVPGLVTRFTISAARGTQRLHLMQVGSSGGLVVDDDGRRRASFARLDGALVLTTLEPRGTPAGHPPGVLTTALAVLLAMRL